MDHAKDLVVEVLHEIASFHKEDKTSSGKLHLYVEIFDEEVDEGGAGGGVVAEDPNSQGVRHHTLQRDQRVWAEAQ